MQKYNIIVESHVKKHDDNNYLYIQAIIEFVGLKINWNRFDMNFEPIFNFLSQLEKNESCELGINTNDNSVISYQTNFKYCTTGFSIGRDEFTILLKINKEIIIDTIRKICDEINKFKEKYPNSRTF